MLDPDEGSLTQSEVRQLQQLSLDQPETWILQSVLAPLNLMRAPSWIQPERWHRQWAVLLKGMAICAGLHDASVSIGEALARAKWPDDRFTKMMEAGPDEIVTYVEWAARHLAESEQPANWNDVRRLIFKSGEHARQFRLRVANDFFRTSYALRRKGL
jgi:CRISPR system Cascade subunit CasB